ncbi:MAG TPA: class I SAM-dependent methyltransferase [Casimicrobiaceae bacterium]|nr:class I SAM-dependent methyltransferase [Casimicrobiaceae bacterium]
MNKDRVRAFTDKIFADMASAMSAGLAYVGTKTGLFSAMSGRGPMTADDVARATGLQPRYVKEWLSGMVSAGYLEYDGPAETYELPDEHAFLLASEGTDHYAGGLFLMVPALMRVAPRVAEAFAKGGGVPFDAFGIETIEALDLLNRGQYEQRLASYWLKSLPEVVSVLEQGASVLDVGCGAGSVVLTIAKAFPKTTIVGIDSSEGSIEKAKASAVREGFSGQVTFFAGAVDDLNPVEKFDLVTICDAVHDFAAPVETLAQVRSRLKPDGVLFVVEPKAGDRLEDNCNAVGAMYYGFSVFHCMTQSLAHGGPGLGTCMGPAKLEALARDAGFTRFERLDLRSNVLAFFAVRL